jgi:mono/diheme cytochrome c family protein
VRRVLVAVLFLYSLALLKALAQSPAPVTAPKTASPGVPSAGNRAASSSVRNDFAPRVTAARREPRPAAAPAAAPILTAATTQGFETVVKPFLGEFCYDCHGNKGEPKNGLNLQSFQTVESLLDQRNHWEDVIGKLRHSEMPPAEEEQPEESRRQAVATWLQREFSRIDRVTPPNPGRVTARRLNRTEYNNTIKELLGVDVRPADDFPQDDAGYGFDNIADVLSLSPVLMEKYVTAADRVTRIALFGPPLLKPTLTRLRSDGRRPGEAREFPPSYDLTGLSLSNAFHSTYRAPVDGEYLIKVFLGGVRPANSDPITITLWVDDREVRSVVHDQERFGRFEIDRQDFGGQTTESRIQLAAGDRTIAVGIPRIFEGLPARYHGPNPSQRPDPPREFVPPPNAPPDRVALLRKRFEEAQEVLDKIPLNGVRIANVEVGGPYSQATAPSRESLAKIYTCGHLDGEHQPVCMTRIVTDFARRAFRRPVTTREVKPFVDLAREAQQEEHSFEEGLAVGLQAILVSPDFLFRLERDRPAAAIASAQPVSQHELASRLSYFLWSSMPDRALQRAADLGTLRQPAVLAAQVRRMLRDPKSHALAENFGGQWLQFRALESVTRDRDRFPDFEDYLRTSMRRETELFIEHIIRDDRSILEFIDGRYSYLNERLARHYGVQNVSGPEFRRVDLVGLPRGGVLTHGSVLTVSSYATRTSPVLRGKWILDNLLAAPPPDPPPDVPNLDETVIGKSASMRDQLEAHRQNTTCASCHKRMDPLGFGLENFNAVGAWRTMDGKFPIDSSGTLPDGREFKGPEELMAILKGDRDAFTRALTGKLLTYALGRGLERYDTKTVRQIATRVAAQNYRFSALVLEIVKSLPFQQRTPWAFDAQRAGNTTEGRQKASGRADGQQSASAK